MNIHMAAFVFGCLLLFVAILGGGFEIKELKVPRVGRASRVSSSLFGMLFIVIGFSPAFAEVLPGLLAEAQPAAAQTTAAAMESRPAALSAQAPAEPSRPRVGKPALRPATPEPEKPSLREKARQKAKRLWSRVW